MKFWQSRIKSKALALTAAIVAAAWLVSPSSVSAAPLLLSTPYPGVTVQPGASVTFPLTVSGPAGKVKLEIVSAPEGWQGEFRGNGQLVHEAFIEPDREARPDFRVQVPEDAKTGNYTIILSARSSTGYSNLALSLKVREGAEGGDKLAVQYPSLSGPDTASFNFRATLTNNSGSNRSYSLGAKAPQGWQVAFKPAYGSNEIASLSLDAGKSQDLDVTIKPPRGVKAGKYNISVAAASTEETVEAQLEVVITGTYRLNLTTPSGRLNADVTAGKKGAVTLEVENQGSANLQGITFSSQAPPNWSVTFEPNEINNLPAGEKRQVTAFITPDNKAIAGDYVVTVTANTPEASSEANLRVTVHTSTLWGLVGVAIVAAVILGVAWAFHKYGRR